MLLVTKLVHQVSNSLYTSNNQIEHEVFKKATFTIATKTEMHLRENLTKIRQGSYKEKY